MTSSAGRPTYVFEGFTLDAQHRVLSRTGGEPILLAPKAFDTLLYFVEHRGELLDKRALLDAIWPNVVVEENNLNQCISTLRRVLGERPAEHRFIVTEPGRGYRFVASVSSLGDADEPGNDVRAAAAATDSANPPKAVPRASSTLRYYAAGVLVLGLIVVAIAGLPWYASKDRSAPLPNSIAVLPFENLSPDPDDAFFAAGLHGDLLSQLAKISTLNVIGQLSMLRISQTGMSTQEIAAALNVQTVLHATVQYADGRMQIIPQLVEAETGKTLWAERYERSLEDIFAVESEIAMEIANALEAEFSVTEQAAIEAPLTTSPAAYAAYLRARDVSITSDALAIEYLDEATMLDPRFALAHAAKAEVYSNAFNSRIGQEAANPSEWNELESRIIAAAAKALELDENVYLAHVALANLHERRWRWTEALRAYERAAPNIPRGTRRIPTFEPFLRDLDFTESIREQREIVALDPLVAAEHWVLGLYYAYPGNAAAAAAEFREAVALAPDDVVMHVWLAHAEGMLGHREEALRELRRAEQLPIAYRSSVTLANLAYAYAQNDSGEDARRLVDMLAAKAPDRLHQASNWVLAYLAIGDTEAARKSLETVIAKIAKQEPEPGYHAVRLIRANIYSDPVLREPSFVALREQLRGR